MNVDRQSCEKQEGGYNEKSDPTLGNVSRHETADLRGK
jgi:hypothetical protein